MHPASMTKLMTLYILFDQLKQGKLKLDDTFRVSQTAWARGESDEFEYVPAAQLRPCASRT